MTLTPDYSRKVVIVTHDDGRTEEFHCQSAAETAYPQLRPEPVVLSRAEERKLVAAQSAGRQRSHDKWGRYQG